MSTHNVQNRIRKLRFESDEMTQQQLAQMVGVTRQTIITIENGKYCPSLDLGFRIAKAFHVDINEVFSYGIFADETDTTSKSSRIKRVTKGVRK